MSAADAFIARLDKVKSTGHGRWRAPCPAHGSKGLTLAIREADNGGVLVHCFAGCTVDEIVGAVGLAVSDLFPPRDNIRYERQPRTGIHLADALACLVQDVRIVKIAATDIRSGVEISVDDWQTFDEAVRRICAVEGVAHG